MASVTAVAPEPRVERSKPATLSRFLFPAAEAALILLMAVLAGGAAWRESVTMDEVAHIGAGVSYVQRFDLRMNPEHPPLPKMIAALPLVARRVRADYSSLEWTISKEIFPATLGEWVFGEHLTMRWNDPRTTLAWARSAMLLLTLALGVVICTYARRIGGKLGGLLCLTVFVSTPAFLAYGPLVLTDVAVTLFSLISLWTFADLWREPSTAHVRSFALSFAASLLSKLSAPILLLAFGAFILSTRLRPLPGEPTERQERKAWRRPRWRATLRGILLAVFISYLFYLIFSWSQPTQYMIPLKQPQDSPRLLGNAWIARIIRRLLLPLWVYLEGVLMLAFTSSRNTFLLGHRYSHGVWFYFPVVFALKSPIGFLGLLATAMGAGWASKRRKPAGHRYIPDSLRTHWRVLWVSLVAFTAVCMLSRLTISIRHFMIPIALLTLLLAPLPSMLQTFRAAGARSARSLQALAAVLAIACLWTTVRAYPYYLPYANALGFGKPVYWLMSDSNVDWNEALPEVRQFAESHSLKTIDVDPYSVLDPKTYVPQARFWNCQRPEASDAGAWAAVSANMILDTHNCIWLMQYPHQAVGGGSMYIFHLPDKIPPPGAAEGPPLASDYREFAGFPADARPTFMDAADHTDHIVNILAKAEAMMRK